MFGLFNKSKSIAEYAESAEILPIVENGDYTAFLIQVDESAKKFGSALSNEKNTENLRIFVQSIDNRISVGDFEKLLGGMDYMYDEIGEKPPNRNLNAERVVVCKGENGYIFKWAP